MFFTNWFTKIEWSLLKNCSFFLFNLSSLFFFFNWKYRAKYVHIEFSRKWCWYFKLRSFAFRFPQLKSCQNSFLILFTIGQTSEFELARRGLARLSMYKPLNVEQVSRANEPSLHGWIEIKTENIRKAFVQTGEKNLVFRWTVTDERQTNGHYFLLDTLISFGCLLCIVFRLML